MIQDEVIVRIPLQDGENTVRFPSNCAYCGEPPTGAIDQKTGVRGRLIGYYQVGIKTKARHEHRGVHMSVPYCAKHLIIARVGRWFLGGVGLAVWFLSVTIWLTITENTFLSEGYLGAFFFIIAAGAGFALAAGASRVVRKVSGLVFPVVNDIPFFTSGSGLDSLGVTGEITYERLALTLRNSSVAEALRQLNTGQPSAATDIEVWREPAKAAGLFSTATSPTDSRSATGSRATGRRIAVVIGLLILVGACLCVGLAIAGSIIAGQGTSLVWP
jgi:hypothetical protein